MCHINTTHVSCNWHDTTRHQKTPNVKFEKNSGVAGTRTHNRGSVLLWRPKLYRIPLCYRAYTMKAGKNQNYISCWRHFVLYGVVSYRIVSYGVVSCCINWTVYSEAKKTTGRIPEAIIAWVMFCTQNSVGMTGCIHFIILTTVVYLPHLLK